MKTEARTDRLHYPHYSAPSESDKSDFVEAVRAARNPGEYQLEFIFEQGVPQ